MKRAITLRCPPLKLDFISETVSAVSLFLCSLEFKPVLYSIVFDIGTLSYCDKNQTNNGKIFWNSIKLRRDTTKNERDKSIVQVSKRHFSITIKKGKDCMKRVSKNDYTRMQAWIYRYAFNINLVKFQFFFEHGSEDDVVRALSYFQNKDGGFISFDPDCWNQNSSPVATFSAYDLLKDIGLTDKNHPMIQGMIRYFENCEYCTDKGCFWSIPSNNHYPCEQYYLYPTAPWHAKGWPAENYINGKYVNFVLRYFEKDSLMYQKILKVIDYRIQFMVRLKEFYSFTNDIEQWMETEDWIRLIRTLKEYGMRSCEECELLEEQLLNLVKSYAKPSTYENALKLVKKLDLKENGEELSSDMLDEMVDSICKNQAWCEDGLRCENPVEKLKEKAHVGYIFWPIFDLIDKLVLLKKYGRIEE